MMGRKILFKALSGFLWLLQSPLWAQQASQGQSVLNPHPGTIVDHSFLIQPISSFQYEQFSSLDCRQSSLEEQSPLRLSVVYYGLPLVDRRQPKHKNLFLLRLL